MLLLNKPVGLTSLEALEQFKKKHPEYKTSKLSYAGRLDPLAQGLLLVLVDSDNKDREKYQGLVKSYEFSVLFGVSTDSYDFLGKITTYTNNFVLDKTYLGKILPQFIGKQEQYFPPYSSKPVNGKALFWWARQQRLNEITIPKKVINIIDLRLTGFEKINEKKIQEIIFKKLEKVTGDFRQEEILADWTDFFKAKKQNFDLAHFKITSSSGTYVRTLVHDIGEKIKIPVLTFSIKRTQIGDYKLTDVLSE